MRTQKSFDQLTRINARQLLPIFLDVTDSASLRAQSELKKKGGNLDALINNAGVAVGPVEGLTITDWHRQFDINFFGLVELTKAVPADSSASPRGVC